MLKARYLRTFVRNLGNQGRQSHLEVMSTQNSLAYTCKNVSTHTSFCRALWSAVKAKDNLNLMIAAELFMNIGGDELQISQSREPDSLCGSLDGICDVIEAKIFQNFSHNGE